MKKGFRAVFLLATLALAFGATPAFSQESPPPENSAESTTESAPAPVCRRTSLSEAIRLAREAVTAKHNATDTDGSNETDNVVDVLWAELEITAVPRYYDIILFDKNRNYLARVDEASAQVLNLTRPGDTHDKEIAQEARQLYSTAHVHIEKIIEGAQDARPRGIPTAARLNRVFGAQPVYEVVLRMPPGNDEVLLVDGMSGNVIELENFE